MSEEGLLIIPDIDHHRAEFAAMAERFGPSNDDAYEQAIRRNVQRPCKVGAHRLFGFLVDDREVLVCANPGCEMRFTQDVDADA